MSPRPLWRGVEAALGAMSILGLPLIGLSLGSSIFMRQMDFSVRIAPLMQCEPSTALVIALACMQWCFEWHKQAPHFF